MDRKPKPRPIRESRVVGRTQWRLPEDGYVTPRLRENRKTEAIGFVSSFDNMRAVNEPRSSPRWARSF